MTRVQTTAAIFRLLRVTSSACTAYPYRRLEIADTVASLKRAEAEGLTSHYFTREEARIYDSFLPLETFERKIMRLKNLNARKCFVFYCIQNFEHYVY
jgi:hypothetical protein